MAGTDPPPDASPGHAWDQWNDPAAAADSAVQQIDSVLDQTFGGSVNPDLDVDHDGDVDQDDIMQLTTENLITSMQTTTMLMAADGAAEAQSQAIDAIYGEN